MCVISWTTDTCWWGGTEQYIHIQRPSTCTMGTHVHGQLIISEMSKGRNQCFATILPDDLLIDGGGRLDLD